MITLNVAFNFSSGSVVCDCVFPSLFLSECYTIMIENKLQIIRRMTYVQLTIICVQYRDTNESRSLFCHFIPTRKVRLKNSHGKIYNANTYPCTLPVKDTLVDPFRTVTRRCLTVVPGRKLRKGSLLEKRGRTHAEGGEDAGERARHSRRSDAQEGERERPGGKWRFEIEERCESPLSVSRGVITLPPRSRRVFVPGTRGI